VDELAKVMPKSYASRIPEAYREWWIEFVQKLRNRMQVKRTSLVTDFSYR
jgi:hypothetical protein